MSSPAPDPSLSKSALKKKAKAVAAQQPSASESESGVAAVAPAAGVEDESKANTNTTGGPGSVVIVKRIKVLAKKVQRVTSYKEIPTEKLNPDQVLALSRLEGIKATLTELEEVKKAVEVAELEQAATLRAQKTAEAANDSQTPETAAVAAPSTSFSVPTLLSFLRLNSVVFPASNGGFAPSQDTPEVVKQLSGQEGAAIGKIAYALLGAGGEEVAQRLVAGGEEEVLEGVTYAKVLSLAQNLAASPAAHTASTSAPVFAPFSPRVAPSTSDVPDVPIQFGSLNDSTSLPPPPVPTKTAGNTDPWKETPSAAAPPPITSKPLAFGTAMTGGADLNDFDEPDLEMEIQTDAVGDAGREGEGEGLAPVDEDKVSSTETPAAPAPASPAVQATINGPEPAGIAIQPPPKTKIDWADTSSLGSLPPIPSFGGTVNIAALSASPLAPKSASPANSKTLSASSNAASTSAPRAPQVQRGWGPSATSSRNSTPPASSSMTTPPSDQAPSTPTSTLNRPNHSFSAQRTGPLPPPFIPRAQQQAQAAAAAAAAAPTNAPLQDEDGFQSVGGRKSRTENNWRSAGGDSNRGGGRGGYRGGRGGGEGGGRGRGGSRGRGGHKGGNADK